MARWHHRLNGHEFEQALGDGDAVHGVAKSRTRLSNLITITTNKGGDTSLVDGEDELK